MRKLKLQMQISVDGFVSTGPDDEQKWVTWEWKETGPYILELHRSADTLVIGRKLAVDLIPYWQTVVAKPDDPMFELAKVIDDFRKIIFTKTLVEPEWSNTALANGNLTDEINRLKIQDGKDILAVGGSSFVSSLIKEGLIDEFHLFVNPVAIGKGIPIFDQLGSFQQLKLQKSIVYDCGIVLLNYVPK